MIQVTFAAHPSKWRISVILIDGEPWREIASALLKNEDLSGDYASFEAWHTTWTTWEMQKTRAKAYELLSRRGFFSKELKDKLRGLGFSASALESVLFELEKQGYINDQEASMNFVSRGIRRKKGPGLISYQLKMKGIEAEITYPKEVRESIIRELLLKKKGKNAIASVARKGFALEEIISIYNSLNMLK